MNALKLTHVQEWPRTAAEAALVQQRLRHQVKLTNDFSTPKRIAGVDVSYDLRTHMSHASVVLIEAESLHIIHSAKAILPTEFPYIPGFLSFREIPVVLAALAQLPESPDLLMVDGQGVAHPRRLGIAAHLGVLLDMPAVGVAKSRLVGRFHTPGFYKGDASPLMDKQERIGTVLRSKDNVNPLFISPGHRVDHEAAVEMTLQCLTKYRLPEPTRLADKLSKTREETTVPV